MLGGADNPNGELPSYITGADMKAVIAVEILARSCCKVKSGRLSVFLSVGHWDILSMDVKVCNNWLFSWMRPGKPWHHDLKRMRSSAISPDARAYQYVGPLYIHTARGYFKRRAESSKFKYKQRIISLTYVSFHWPSNPVFVNPWFRSRMDS